MSVAELKRCFECGATYPQEVLACANDGTPLCFDTVGRRWKIEGVIGRRTGGAIFAAFQLVSGQYAAIDMLPGQNAREATAAARFNQQLQALRILDQNKSILRLIEEGTERDGSRFMVTELGELRPLQDLIDEWRRPDGVLMEPGEAALLVRPLLSLLSTAARLGMAHGLLDATQIFVGSANDFAGGLTNVATVKLHGLAAIGMGPQLRAAQAADLRGIGRVLYELCTGKLPPAGELLGQEPLPLGLDGPLGQVVLRAVGAPGTTPYATAEELQRALSTAALGGRPPSQASVPPPLVESAISAPAMPSAPRLPALPSAMVTTPEPTAAAKFLSLPPMPSGPGSGKNSLPPNSLPPVRVTAQHSAVPAPLGSLISGPQRSGLTSELRQVSILDLMREMNEQKEKQETTAREETLARSRFRPSLNNIKPMPRPDANGRDPNAPAELSGLGMVSNSAAVSVQQGPLDSGATVLEPTVVDPNNSPAPPTLVQGRGKATAPNWTVAPGMTKAGTAPNQGVAPGGPKAGTAPNQIVAPGGPKAGTAPNRTITPSGPSGSSPPASPAGAAADSGAAASPAAGETATSAAASPSDPGSPRPTARSRPADTPAQSAVTATTPTISGVSPPAGSPAVPVVASDPGVSRTAPPGRPAEPAADPAPAPVSVPPVSPVAAAPALATTPAAPLVRGTSTWTWVAVIGPLLAIIAALVFKLLTRK